MVHLWCIGVMHGQLEVLHVCVLSCVQESTNYREVWYGGMKTCKLCMWAVLLNVHTNSTNCHVTAMLLQNSAISKCEHVLLTNHQQFFFKLEVFTISDFNKFGQNHVGLKHHKSAIQPMIKIDTFPEIISFCECQITPHQYHDNLTFQISQLQYPNSSSKIKTFLNMKFKNLHTSKYQQTRGKVAQFRTKAGFLATLLSMCASYIEETDRLKIDRYEQHESPYKKLLIVGAIFREHNFHVIVLKRCNWAIKKEKVCLRRIKCCAWHSIRRVFHPSIATV